MLGLEIATTRQLIDELMARRTFVGIIVASNEEHLTDGQVHNDFRVRTTVENEITRTILERVLESLPQK